MAQTLYAVVGAGTPSYDEGDRDVWLYSAHKQVFTRKDDAIRAMNDFCEGEQDDLEAQGATERHWQKVSDTEWECEWGGDVCERVQVVEFKLEDEQ